MHQNWRLLASILSGSVISRRIQMSSVFQIVRTGMLGVPLVPRAPGPCFQPLSSKSGFVQSAEGFWTVYFQMAGLRREVGTTIDTSGLGGRGAQLPTLA